MLQPHLYYLSAKLELNRWSSYAWLSKIQSNIQTPHHFYILVWIYYLSPRYADQKDIDNIFYKLFMDKERKLVSVYEQR